MKAASQVDKFNTLKKGFENVDMENDRKDERIGWFQLQLLLQLAFRPKYGYEIINEMKVNDIKISTGQVYPALKKLENSKFLRSFSKKGKAARRKYYEITEKGIFAIKKTIKPMLWNLIPAVYTLLADIKKTIFADNTYKIGEGETTLFYSDPIKQPLLDLARVVGDTGKVYITVKTPASLQTINDFAVFFNFDKVIQPVIVNKGKIQLESNKVNSGIIMMMLRITDIPVDTVISEVMRCVKKNGQIFIISTEPNIFSETFLNFFDFHYGYKANELEDICKRNGLKIDKVDEVRRILLLKCTNK
ncbi:MAG: PadR family transcriptional regulator [Candidatus Helarchaeota archaeon]